MALSTTKFTVSGSLLFWIMLTLRLAWLFDYVRVSLMSPLSLLVAPLFAETATLNLKQRSSILI